MVLGYLEDSASQKYLKVLQKLKQIKKLATYFVLRYKKADLLI